MIARVSILLFTEALALVAGWLLGYHEGQSTGAFYLLHQMGRTYTRDVNNGMDMDRDQVCGEIRRYKESVARDLDENTQICGYPDIDGPENSN
jgi:hypothetical protein